MAGTGEIYKDFKRTGKLANYSGFGEQPTTFYEPNFATANVREIKYDQTFYVMPYDVRKSRGNFLT